MNNEYTTGTTHPSAPYKNYKTGLIFGLIAGVIYIILLSLKFNYFSSTPKSFNGFAIFSYSIILILYFLTGYISKKQAGGYIETREVFLPMFIAILIAEFSYILFNYLYIAVIDPEFMSNYIQATRLYLESQGMDSEIINEQLEQMNIQVDAMTNFKTSFMGFGLWVIIDSIICLVFSLALRKPRM